MNLPSSLNPQNMQTRNLAAAIVTIDLPPFARTGARIDALVSALGDARSLQGGTLMMTPMRGADGRVYALAQGPLTVEGYFASASGGASERKNFQTAGQISGGATVEREVPDDFGHNHELELDLNDPDALVAMRAADAINRRYKGIAVAVLDPGTLHITLPPALSAVSFAAALNNLKVESGESARVVMDERTGTIVVGGAVTVGRAAISHGNLIVTIAPTLTVPSPARSAEAAPPSRSRPRRSPSTKTRANSSCCPRAPASSRSPKRSMPSAPSPAIPSQFSKDCARRVRCTAS